MAWLAVDENGDECIYQDKPVIINNDSFWSTGNEYNEFFVELPKGTIMKLLGRELRWGEGPVELK